MKFIYSILTIALLLTSVSCRKLDVSSESQYTTGNFPSTTADYASVIGPMYAQLASSADATYAVDYWRLQELSTEEAIIPARGGNYDDNGQYRFLHRHTWTIDHPTVTAVWKWGFGGINTANRLISMFTALPDNPAKLAGMAEVKAMRALYYFFMMDLYGNIPIVETFPVAGSPVAAKRADVFAFIEKDLKSIIPDLPADVSTATYGHATRWMAYALLEKMYLNAAVYTGTQHYTEAVAMADSILKGNKFGLDGDYTSIFKPTNGPLIKETIFAVPYDANLIPGCQFTRFGLHPFLQAKYNIPFRPSIALSTIPEFYAYFNLNNDVRNTTWLSGKQYNVDGTPMLVATTRGAVDDTYTGADKNDPINWQVEIFPDIVPRNEAGLEIGNDLHAQLEGVRSIKFYPDPAANPSTRYQNNDVPVFRLADVLMMKAEAILRGAAPTVVNGENQTPDVLVNKIRSRAGAPKVSTIDLDGLLAERAREFAWEAWRRNDLIRFGKFESKWGFKTNDEMYRRLYPIPATEKALNPSLGQNEGYPK